MSQDEFNSDALPQAASASPGDATAGEAPQGRQEVTGGGWPSAPRAPEQVSPAPVSADERPVSAPPVAASMSDQRPSRVGLVAILLVAAGVFNVLVGTLFSCGALGGSISTVGGSLLCVPVTLGTLMVGVGGVWVGYRHTQNEPGLKSPLMWVSAQLFGLLSCSWMAFALSLVALLILLTDKEVKAYFAEPASG